MTGKLSALLLAAGESKRMGQPKLLLPWGEESVFGRVLSVFSSAGIEELVVITGGGRELVEDEARRLGAMFPNRVVYNPNYKSGGMLSSIQQGIRSLSAHSPGVVIGLGDQPQVQEETVRAVCAAFAETGSLLVVPSHRGRRGHPWMVRRPLWEEILSLPATTTAREFLSSHAAEIQYIEAGETILQDLDTPEDYGRVNPGRS